MSKVFDFSRGLVRRSTPTRWVRHYIYLLGALLLLVSITAVGALQVQANQINRLNEAIAPAFDANNQVLKAMSDAQMGLLGYQAFNDRNLLIPYRGAYARTLAALERLQDALLRLRDHKIEDNSTKVSLDGRHRLAVQEWWAYARSTEPAVLRGEKIDVVRTGALFESFRRANAVLREYLSNEQDQALSEARTTADIGLAATIAAAAIALFAIIFLGWLFARRVSQPLIHLRQTMSHQRSGDSTSRAREDLGSLEIQSLAIEFNSLVERNFDLLNHVKDVSTRMASLVDLSLTLGQKLSLDDLLNQIVESARQVLGARYAAIGVLDVSGDRFAELVTVGFSAEEKFAIGELPTHHPPMDSFLAVPVIIDGEVYANLYVTNKIDGQFTADDEQVAVAFALQTAVAVGNVLRYEMERQRANMLESVREIEYAVRTASDTQQTLDVLCAALGEKIGCDRVIAKVGNVDDQLMASAQWHQPSVGDLPDELVPYIGPLAQELWRMSEHLVVDDLLASQVLSQRGEIFYGYTDARAAIVVPIGLGERVIGVIYVIMVHQPRKWTVFEVNAVQQVTAFVARAIVEAEFRANQSEHIELLKRLERQKSNFVATVSHELRTPLTSIIGYLELLQHTDANELSADQLQMLEAIDRNANRLRTLIEDLLLLNQRESGELKATVAEVAICELITEICLELSPIAQSQTVELDLDAGPKTAIVLGDIGQLRIALVNIVSNAIKFSQPGGAVTINCVLDEGNRRVRFICQDRGIGIPSDDQGQIFNRFFRASNATSQVIAGTGLGLSIVKQIIEDHGGVINLTSVEGEGTTVVVDLPLSVGRSD